MTEDRPSLSRRARTAVIDAASDAVRRPRWRPDRAAVGFVLAGAGPPRRLGGPAAAGLSESGWHALATLAAFVALLALEALPDGALSLALVGVWVLGGGAPRSPSAASRRPAGS